MKRLLFLAMLFVSGCDLRHGAKTGQQNDPIKVSESNGVIVWKVYDGTKLDRRVIYYTSPAGHLLKD